MELFTPEIFDIVYFLFKQTCPQAFLSGQDYLSKQAGKITSSKKHGG
jgi:hypothetical protein